MVSNSAEKRFALENISPIFRNIEFLSRKRGFKGNVHVHPHYQINFVESGQMSISDCNTNFSLGRGQLCIVPPKQHHFQHTTHGYEQLRIDLNGHLSNKINEMMETYITQLTILSVPDLLGDLSTLKNETNPWTELSRMKKSNLLERFLLTCIEVTLLERENGFANRLVQILKQNVTNKLLLKDLSVQLDLSPAQLERLSAKEFGCGVIELHNRIRLDQACSLLAHHSNLSIESIADQLGFYDCSHFTRVFKRKIQMTPLQYRKLSSSQ